MDIELSREKAINLVNAYFDGKEIAMKDPKHGVMDWISIKNPEYWSYLAEFCKSVDKYKIIDSIEEIEKLSKEYDKLYDKILSGDEDWDYSDLDRLLTLNLLLNE